MTKTSNNSKTANKYKFDLEERTTNFAKQVIRLCKSLPRNPINDRLVGQTVGSAESIEANYREANDVLGKKDFIHRLKIARKEAKEVCHWLEPIEEANPKSESDIWGIREEANELKAIFSSIITKSG